VGPGAGEARQRILHARERHLEHRLACARAVGEDVEDDFLSVDHGHAGELLPVALLRGRKRLVDHDEVGLGGLRGLDDLLGFPAPDQRGRRGLAQVDQLLVHDLDAEILHQLLELGEQLGRLAGSHFMRLDAHKKSAVAALALGLRNLVEKVGH